MKWVKLSASIVLPAAVLAFHPLGCGILYTCEDDGTCVEIPEGFTGYHFVREVADATATAERCGDGAEPTAYFMNPPPDVPQKCRKCACDWQNVVRDCSLPELECWDGESCNGSIKLKNDVDVGTCAQSTWNHKSDGEKFNPSGVASCSIGAMGEPEVGVTEEVSDLPTWGTRFDACNAPAQEAADMICIKASGHGLTCPTGWDHNIEAYTNGVDARRCSACSCEARCKWDGYVIGDYCYDNEPQSILPNDVIDGTTPCSSIDYVTYGYGIKTTAPELIGDPTGGDLTGEFVPKGPVTFCCKPAE